MKDNPYKVSVHDIIPKVHLEPIVLPDETAPPEPRKTINLMEAYSLDTNDINSFENIINKHKGEKQ